MALYRKKIDLGTKPETIKETPKKKKYYPTFYVSDKKLPLGPDDVGKDIDCKAKVTLIGIRESTNENKSDFSYDFEVKEIVF